MAGHVTTHSMAPPKRKFMSSPKKTDSRSRPGMKDWNHDSDVSSVGSSAYGEEDEEGRDRRLAEQKETADEKRTRLAKDLLERLEQELDEDDEEGEEDGEEEVDRMDLALKKDMMKDEGRFVRPVAEKLKVKLLDSAVERFSYKSVHKQSVTSICVAENDSTCYSGSKDGGLIGWDVETNAPKWRPNHSMDQDGRPHRILGVACSTDGTYVATCGDKKGSAIRIWDARESGKDPIKVLSGHRDVVTSLVFRRNSPILLSGSDDRSIRIYNAQEGSFVENLFGHYARICGVDCLNKERCITSSEDMTVRFWKIPEESHLLLSGKHRGPIDCVKMITETTFISGSQDGQLSLWSSTKKRPANVVHDAHGPDRWIESVAVLRSSDVIASGSDDGLVRLWRVDVGGLRIDQDPIAAFPVIGHANSIAFGNRTDDQGHIMVVGVGQEPRLGRWRVSHEAKNGVAIFRF